MIQLDQVRKIYGQHVAVDNVSFTVEEGETVALLGASGCGKTTILKMIAGLVDPTSGELWVSGQQMTANSRLEIRRHLGYVMQDGGLFPHLTAEGNIMLMPRHLRRPEHEVAKRLQQLCEICHFDARLLSQYPCQLSGGQRQRVGLMRGLILDPDVILMDEPLGALDPMVRASLQQDLKDIFSTLGKTVLLVTHDVGEACFLADRIVLLDRGVIAQEGRFEAIVRTPRSDFVRSFIQAQRRPSF